MASAEIVAFPLMPIARENSERPVQLPPSVADINAYCDQRKLIFAARIFEHRRMRSLLETA